jgi:hypothetical protein
MSDFELAGSWTSGTMRLEDLIPSFVDLMQALPAASTQKHMGGVAEIEARMGDDDYYESEAADFDLEELFDMLNDVAPAGYYFSASEGDGADYGYWEVENDVEASRVASKFWVVRVNGDNKDTYAASTKEKAIELAQADEYDNVEVRTVEAPDAGAARLMWMQGQKA